jgi:hypothetical protein
LDSSAAVKWRCVSQDVLDPTQSLFLIIGEVLAHLDVGIFPDTPFIFSDELVAGL